MERRVYCRLENKLKLLKLLHHPNHENASVKFDEFKELLNKHGKQQKVFLKELRQNLIELDAALFNRRITKYVKLSDKLDTRSLRNIMKIKNPLLDIIQRNFLVYASRDNYITSHRHSRNKRFGHSDMQPSTTDTELNKRLEETHYVSNDELVNVLVDIAEGSETNNIGVVENNTYVKSISTTENSVRLRGCFISDNVFNLSNKSFTDHEIKLLSRGLGFVPTPEKIDRGQLKQDLEKFGRNLRLKISYLGQPAPLFLETPAFRPPSNWMPLIRDTQLELYLSDIEDELLKINEDGKNYANISKEERSALQDLMKDKRYHNKAC